MNDIARKFLPVRVLMGILLLSIMVVGGHIASAQCPLSMTVTSAPVRQLSVADVDFEHFQSHALLFTINIANTSSNTVMANLEITLSVQLADGSLTESNAMDFITKDFAVPAGGRTITNLNIGVSGEITGSATLTDEAKNKVEDVALSTGKFPAGIYTFTPKLTCSGSESPISGNPITYVIENPSRVELRSPQDGEITSEFPLFEYYSDGSDVILTVAEKSENQSREDAIAQKPAMQEVELVNQNSYLYSGGRPLEAGKTYVWQVVSRTLNSGGTWTEVASPIGLFTVSSNGNTGVSETNGGNVTPDMILDQLEQIFGSRYASIFQQIRAGGFRLTGHYVLNDSTLTQTDLLNLINELRRIADSVDVGLE